MYKEVVKPVGRTVILVIGAIAVSLIFMGIVDAALLYFNVPYKSIWQLASLAVVAIIVYSLIRYKVSDYEYFLIENELIITSKLGSNERMILKLDTDMILYICRCDDKKARDQKAVYRYNAKKSFLNKDVYVCFFNQDNKLNKLRFEPSEKLLDLLRKRGVSIL